MNVPSRTGLRAAVILASAGRPGLLQDIVEDIDAQTYPLAARVLAVPDEASLPADISTLWVTAVGSRGLAAQRNAGLDALDALDEPVDVVFFFDDDAVVRPDYIERGIRYFQEHADLVGLTGRVLLDGAAHSSGEISRAEALTAIDASQADALTEGWSGSRTLYGCNFAYRRSAVPGIRFDARLPLYSWLEDHDFARRLMRGGTLATVDDCVIVHRGAASGGRTNHVRLGYSQLMNPVYLVRAGSFPLWLGAWEIFRPTAKNVAYAVAGSERQWRRERVRGNALALRDAIGGHITPERITNL